MCKLNPGSFCFGFLSILSYISVFVSALINMIFSIVNPKESKTFKYIEYLDYSKPINYNFLMDLNFGSNLTDNNDYGFIGSLDNRCYLGKCIIIFEKKSN